MSPRRVGARVALVVVAAALASCVMPSPRHSACRDACRADHDRCVVDSMNGAALQACDQELTSCIAACSR